MVGCAPNTSADRTGSLRNTEGGENHLIAIVAFGSGIGGMSINIGAAVQTATDDYVDSVSIAASAGMGGATVGSSW